MVFERLTPVRRLARVKIKLVRWSRARPTWLEPYTPQLYFGSTIANALVWIGMCYMGIKLWARATLTLLEGLSRELRKQGIMDRVKGPR